MTKGHVFKVSTTLDKSGIDQEIEEAEFLTKKRKNILKEEKRGNDDV